MDSESEVEFNFPPFLRTFKSGRVERFQGTSVVPPSVDPAAAVSSRDVVIDPATQLSARLYLPNSVETETKLPILIYFHGGAFCIESAHSPTYHNFLNPFAAQASVLVVSVNYRLAPEHKLPAGYEDSWAAFQWAMSLQDEWLAKHGDVKRVFLGGDSAGANIAHQMALRASAVRINIEGMILVHPYFGKRIADEAERAGFEEVWKLLSEEEVDCLGHYPMGDKEKGMAIGTCKRVIVCVAEQDGLRERGAEYFEALKGTSGWGGEAEFVETEEEDHVFHLMKPGCVKGVHLVDRLAAFINK